MQIALVAVVLLAGMWFTVLRPKSDDGGSSSTPAPAAATPNAPASKAAPGVKGLTSAIGKAKGAAATSDAANAKIQRATGGAPAAAKSAAPKAAAPAAKAAPVKKLKAAAPVVAAKKPATKTDTDPSGKLLAHLTHGKVVVVLFHAKGADDRAAMTAVRRLAGSDKKVVAAYPSISQVGRYETITRDLDIMVAPTVVVIGQDRKARVVTGYTDVDVLRQMVGDARRAAKK